MHMNSRKTLYLCLGRICVQLAGCDNATVKYITEKCAEFLSSGSDPDFTIEIFYKKGKIPRQETMLDLAVTADNGIITGVCGESKIRLNSLRKRGTFHIDIRMMPASLENCIRVAFAALLAWKGDILLHATGILRKGLVYLFFGPSEAGKSTIAIMRNDGTVLNDESMVMYIDKDKIKVQGTPFWGDVQGFRSSSTPFPIR